VEVVDTAAEAVDMELDMEVDMEVGEEEVNI
jgi:hypothetical protein